MRRGKCILLNLNSDLAKYKLEIYDSCRCYCGVVTSNTEVLKFYTSSPYFSVVATPLNVGNYKKIQRVVFVTCAESYRINFKFINTPNLGLVYRFSLNDTNYGLPVDGILTFNKI